MRGFLKQKNNIWVILASFGGVCPPLGPPGGVGGSITPNTRSLWVAWSYQQIKRIGKIISPVKMVEDTCRGLLRQNLQIHDFIFERQLNMTENKSVQRPLKLVSILGWEKISPCLHFLTPFGNITRFNFFSPSDRPSFRSSLDRIIILILAEPIYLF